MNCEAAKQDFTLYLYGELEFEQEEQIEQHLSQCGSCQAELESMRAFHAAMDQQETEPSPELLVACRRELRSRTTAMRQAEQNTLWARLRRFFTVTVPSPAFLRPVGALALVAFGFTGGRLWDVSRNVNEPSALRVRNLTANESGGVDLIVEEVRQKTLSGQLNDDRIRGMLLTAATDPSDPGLRARTLEALKAQCEQSDVRRALLRALAWDSNPGVRLKAIEALRPVSRDPETRRVLAQVLLEDDNPGVRTQAVDMLASEVQIDVIGTLQEVIVRESNPYIRQKTLKALREANASVETF
ncbi:MAG: HEAT repeat domain-containing protein [Acidobacteria bacterium]|nr:HEAT repeat domain-containing protein [Acidobacteriota bacterium]